MTALATKRTAHEAPTDAAAPRVDIHESGDALVLTAEVPGVPRDGVDIQVDGGVLVLTATREKRELGKALLASRVAPVYRRSFQLPDTVDPERIEAKLERGVLEIRLPKRESLKPRRIEVRAS